jgi:hypothetical protein
MSDKKEVFVLNLPNVGNDDVIEMIKQLIHQPEYQMDCYRIENKNLVVDIVIKKN